MVTIDEFSRLVSGIYAAAVTPNHRGSALRDIHRTLGGSAGSLLSGTSPGGMYGKRVVIRMAARRRHVCCTCRGDLVSSTWKPHSYQRPGPVGGVNEGLAGLLSSRSVKEGQRTGSLRGLTSCFPGNVGVPCRRVARNVAHPNVVAAVRSMRARPI